MALRVLSCLVANAATILAAVRIASRLLPASHASFPVLVVILRLGLISSGILLAGLTGGLNALVLGSGGVSCWSP